MYIISLGLPPKNKDKAIVFCVVLREVASRFHLLYLYLLEDPVVTPTEGRLIASPFLTEH